MSKEIVIQRDNEGTVELTNEVYEKFCRMVALLGGQTNRNSWRNTFYLLVLLYNCLEIRIPYVIEKNYNFFSQDEIRLLEKLYFEIKALNNAHINNNVLCDLSETNRIMSQFMSLYDTINDFFEFRLYAHKREVLLRELKKCLNESDYMKYRMKLIGAGEDLKKLQEVVQECEKVMLEDWRKKLTNPNEYRPGEEYAFICHAGAAPKTSRLVSASLLTNRIFTAYENSQVLFILDHSSMFNTEPSDCFINNYCLDPILAKTDHLLSILTKETLEEQTLERQETIEKNYNEVDLYEFRPIGILIMLEDEHDTFHCRIGEEMQQEYPHLPLVYINKSMYKQKVFKKGKEIINSEYLKQ